MFAFFSREKKSQARFRSKYATGLSFWARFAINFQGITKSVKGKKTLQWISQGWLEYIFFFRKDLSITTK